METPLARLRGEKDRPPRLRLSEASDTLEVSGRAEQAELFN
jgi:hypothetical protein